MDLYESTPGATVCGIAADLGVVRGTLRQWLEAYGTDRKTAADQEVPRRGQGVGERLGRFTSFLVLGPAA